MWPSWRAKRGPGGGAERAKKIADAHAYEYAMRDGSRGNIRTEAIDERAVERAGEKGVRRNPTMASTAQQQTGFACNMHITWS